MFSYSMLAPLSTVTDDLVVIAVGYTGDGDTDTVGAVSWCSVFDWVTC